MASRCEWLSSTPLSHHERDNRKSTLHAPAKTALGQERKKEVTETPRQRATAIVERDGRVLLVRDKWRPAFMLPGGGIDEGESPEVAIERELCEETTLTATAVQYLFTHDGKYNHHHVFSVQADGDVDIGHDPMVVEFAWWDGKADVPVHPHVGEILRKVRSMTADGQNGGDE